ncbi:hypothetical protein FB45DRAFT_1013705 [Roridomyces roridus]|uniref:Uncharacterized protein n=1 Tax=Roridomyces roridus TaxID=1738132 RepID=A0AAD7F826_9AGAR|nr:hypothetical protein FB45DRAFT_1013705 [Roridomyces roridus]
MAWRRSVATLDGAVVVLSSPRAHSSQYNTSVPTTSTAQGFLYRCNEYLPASTRRNSRWGAYGSTEQAPRMNKSADMNTGRSEPSLVLPLLILLASSANHVGIRKEGRPSLSNLKNKDLGRFINLSARRGWVWVRDGRHSEVRSPNHPRCRVDTTDSTAGLCAWLLVMFRARPEPGSRALPSPGIGKPGPAHCWALPGSGLRLEKCQARLSPPSPGLTCGTWRALGRKLISRREPTCPPPLFLGFIRNGEGSAWGIERIQAAVWGLFGGVIGGACTRIIVFEKKNQGGSTLSIHSNFAHTWGPVNGCLRIFTIFKDNTLPRITYFLGDCESRVTDQTHTKCPTTDQLPPNFRPSATLAHKTNHPFGFHVMPLSTSTTHTHIHGVSLRRFPAESGSLLAHATGTAWVDTPTPKSTSAGHALQCLTCFLPRASAWARPGRAWAWAREIWSPSRSKPGPCPGIQAKPGPEHHYQWLPFDSESNDYESFRRQVAEGAARVEPQNVRAAPAVQHPRARGTSRGSGKASSGAYDSSFRSSGLHQHFSDFRDLSLRVACEGRKNFEYISEEV